MANELKELEFDGFKFKVNPDSIDDMEFLELADAVENVGDMSKYPALVKMLIGEEYYRAAVEHFKGKYGKFSATKCGEMFSSAIKALDPKD